jgi:cobalt-zinc-cadmium efflux system protein
MRGGGHLHGHGGPVTATGGHRRTLVIVLIVTLAVTALQLIGGILSGSLALLADAGHMLADAAGVGAALVAAALATRPATSARTFGLLRAEILAALANAVLLGGVAIWVLVEAAQRWDEPPDVETGLMLGWRTSARCSSCATASGRA